AVCTPVGGRGDGAAFCLHVVKVLAQCEQARLGREIAALVAHAIPVRETMRLPSTRTSIRVRRKQSSASSGLQTTGSFSLNEVLRTMGTPVRSRKASIRR